MISWRIFRNPWLRFGMVAILVIFAAGLRIWPLSILELRLAWLTFYPAVVIASLVGGFSTGIFATAMSLLIIIFWSPTGQPFLVSPADWLGAWVFVFNATLISGMGEMNQRAQRRSEKAREDAEKALHDLTKTQTALVESEKMASLGGLVAGVAHEINTPIGVTLAAASHLEAETLDVARRYKTEELTSDELEAYFTTASEATRLMTVNSQRASSLIQSFKQVAVDQTGEGRRRFELKNYLDEIILSLSPRLKRTSHKVLVYCPTQVEMESVPGALSQCLSNLILNSLIHGYDDGASGVLAIRVSLPNAESVEITYSDDGKGMPENVRRRAFDPFFTTRRDAGGSGLGLHIVYNLVRSTLKGDIRLISEAGRGVVFTLRLPRFLSSLDTQSG